VTGEHDRFVRQPGKCLETLVHLLGIRSGQVGAPTSIEKQGVSRDEAAAGKETLAARSVAGCMHEGDVDRPDGEDVARRVRHEMALVDFGRADDPRDLFFVDMNRYVVHLEEVSNAVDAVTHHRATDVVGVIMRRENARQLHPIGCDDAENLVDGVGGIDHDALSGSSVAHEIDVIHHLRGETVANRKIPAREKLTEVKRVVCGHAVRIWPTLCRAMNARPDTKVLVGDTLVDLSPEMSAALESGGRLIPLRGSGTILVVPAGVRRLVDEAVTGACNAFAALQQVPHDRVDAFFGTFADAIEDDARFAPVLAANSSDVESARERGRATGRLAITPKMRRDMADGLRMWATLDMQRLSRTGTLAHDGWTVESWRAPLGVVAFVFEGRPNVFADATGVLKSGNSVVFRIGSDALGTARAIRDEILMPSLKSAGLPDGAVSLIDSAEHAAGWALFDDERLALAVARGSGSAVGQLGEIARQAGTPVSLHGTGGAWLIVGSSFDADRLFSIVRHSLDRKVCNTLNTIVLLEEGLEAALPILAGALTEAGRAHGNRLVVHTEREDIATRLAGTKVLDIRVGHVDPGVEWEWDQHPEVTVLTAGSVSEAVGYFNAASPRFVLSVVSTDPAEEEFAWEASEAPFFGDGFTRWVDGQFALARPELGLANWQTGRLLGRGGVLSGDSVHTVRLRVRQTDPRLHR